MNNKNSKKSNNKKNTSKSIKNKNNKKVIKNKECNKYFKILFMFSSLLNLLLIILSLILIVLYIKNNNKINDLNENINDLKKSIIKKDNEKEPIKEEVIIKNKATKIPVLSYHRTVTSDIRNKYFKLIKNEEFLENIRNHRDSVKKVNDRFNIFARNFIEEIIND